MHQLIQPLFSPYPEPGHHQKDILNLEEFLDLLRLEEDYYQGEQGKTRTMISRLRKIFYDQWGWNSELIRGASSISQRYGVEIVENDASALGQHVPRHSKGVYSPKTRKIVYLPNDLIFPEKAGQTPEIYANDHQELRLPEGNLCDIAHVLAGLDAFNHPQVVSPMPQVLHCFATWVPHVRSNMDVVTWLGDIASSAGDFLFESLQQKKALSTIQMQTKINIDAPASDMLGDIDPYVIAQFYTQDLQQDSRQGKRVTDILRDYYFDKHSPRNWRCTLFAKSLGLKWDPNNKSKTNFFINQKQWIQKYHQDLKNNVIFQVFSLTDEKLDSLWLPIKVWLDSYSSILKLKELLEIFLYALAEGIRLETPLPIQFQGKPFHV